MKKKILSLLIVLTFVIGMLPGAVMASGTTESVAFFNAESDRQIGTIDNQSSVYAKVSFTAPKDGTASIIAAKYDSMGALISADVVATPVMTKDAAVECTTADISVSGADTLKIMGWDGFLSMTPVLKNPGILKGLDENSSFVKFEKAAEDLTFVTGTTVELGSIFKVAEPLLFDIDADAVEVTVLAVEGSTASGTYTKNTEDWTKGTVSFTGLGEVTISVTDNYYCTPTTVTATVKEPNPVDKFTAKENLEFKHTLESTEVTKTLGDLFEAVEDADIDNASVTVTGAEYTQNTEDWTKSEVKFDGVGEYTVTITDNKYCNIATATVKVLTPDPIDKFVAKENLTFEHTVQGETIEKTLGDIFATVENVTLKNESIKITVTDSENVKTTLVENSEDWTQGTLSFSGAGAVVISITDNYYCNEATATVTITEPESADKFEAKDNLTFKHTIDDTVVTKSIGEIFTAIEGADIDSVKVTVMTNSEKAVYTKDSADWTKGTLKFDGAGEYVVTISDNNYCNDAVAIVKIEEPDPIDKFVGKDGLSYELKDAEITVALGDIFTAKDNVTVNNAGVTVDGATYAQNASDWTKGTLTFTAPGTYTITITDNKYCNNATATVTITEPVPVDKFDLVFEHTDKFLYRVGNQNTVALGSLFKAKDGAEIGEVTVKVEANNSNASGVYTKNADWTKGTIQFAGTGPVKVTIVDDKYCNELTLNLEVVDAVNAKTSTSATANNVVLLNDCGFGSLEVKNGYTLYGNGFTMTCASDSPALYRRYAFVEMENGTIDNVQIECPNFSHAILYESNKTENGNPTDSTGDRYYNIRSAVMTDGVCNIYNSKISGGRVAVYQRSGTTTIDKSTIVGGAAANIQIETVKGLTLKDVSLIQKPIQATVNDTSKILMGLSVVAFCDESGNVSPITLEGELHQYAWACSEYSKYVPSAGSSLVSTVLNQKDYIHAITYEDGVTRDSINLGFAFVQETFGKSVSSNIIDNRSNKDSVLYDTAELSLAHIYSYKNTNGTDDSFKTIPEYESTGYNATLPEMEFAEQRDGLTFTNQYSADNQREATLNVDLDTLGAYNFSFNNLNVVKNGANLAYKVFDSNGNELNKDQAINLSSSDMRDYTLEITDNLFYDKDGNLVQGKEETYTYKFELVATMTSIDPPTKVAEPGGTPLLVAKSYDGDWSCAIPALEGTQIKYWSVTEKAYKTLALSSLTPTTTGKQNGTETFWEKSTDDFTLKVTCGVIHDTKGVYGMPVVVNNNGNKMYFTISSTNGYVSTNTGSRAVTITYEFADKNGGTLKFSKSWTFNRADYTEHQYSYSDFVSGTLTELSSSSGGGGGFPCVTADTLITLADGTQKRIDEVQYSDELLVWDFYNGEYTIVPASYINNHGYGYNTIITLNFEDGTQVKVSNVHGFYDANLNEFVMIDDTNVENLVGHRFVQQDGNGYKAVKLTSYDIKEEYSESYSLLTYKYYNCIVEGLFSLTASEVAGNLFMPFEVGKDMTFDKAKMQSDIEKYGLYTYEEFADRLTLEEFEALNMPYIKIAVEKGIVTYDEVLFLLDLHFAK